MEMYRDYKLKKAIVNFIVVLRVWMPLVHMQMMPSWMQTTLQLREMRKMWYFKHKDTVYIRAKLQITCTYFDISKSSTKQY